MREPLIIENSFITVPVSDAVGNVLNEFFREHKDELDARLMLHGLQLADIAALPVERLVYEDEVQKETP